MPFSDDSEASRLVSVYIFRHRNIVWMVGFEPTAAITLLSQLSYIHKSGAEGLRSPYLLLAKQALCRLSYGPLEWLLCCQFKEA